MSWNVDQLPLDYLRRRVVYYKKKGLRVRNLKFPKTKQYLKAITLKSIDEMIKRFELAIKILEDQVVVNIKYLEE